MKDEKIFKDIINLILIISSDGLFYLAPIIYPYITFYYKNYNEEIDMKDVYTAFCGSYFGRVLANLIIPSIIFNLGTKKTIQIGGILYFINFFLFAYFPSKISLYLNSIFYGFIFQFRILPVNYYICKKYKKGITYLKHIYTGFNISAFFWTFTLFYIVNPENVNNVILVKNGFDIHYKVFDNDIYNNVPLYFYLNGILSMFVTVYCAENLESENFKEESFFLKSLYSSNENIELSDLSKKTCLYEKKIEKLAFSLKEKKTNLSIFSQNLSSEFFIPNKDKEKVINNNKKNYISKNSPVLGLKKVTKIEKILSFKSYNKEKLTDPFFLSKIQLTTEQAYRKANKEIFTSKFLLLLLIVIFKSSSSAYFIAYTKYISYSIIKNDKEITFFIAFMAIPDILGRYFFSYVWKKFGFFKTTLFSIIMTTSLNIIFIFFGYKSPKIFLLLIFMNTINYTTMLLLTNMTLFSFYDPKEALILSRIFEIHSFLSRIYATTLNWIFVHENDFTKIFIYFSIGEIISFFLFYIQFRNKKLKPYKNKKLFF